MQIYLLRHGIAEDRAVDRADATRALTAEGIRKMEQAAAGMRRLNVAVDLLLSSPLIRAQQTAEIVGQTLGLSVLLEPALAPGFDLPMLLALLEKLETRAAQRVMLVGHEPDLGLLTSGLIGGGQIELKKGGLALVDLPHDVEMDGVLRWLLPPSILRAIGTR
jgi:phosphohistidine phosphatase